MRGRLERAARAVGMDLSEGEVDASDQRRAVK